MSQLGLLAFIGLIWLIGQINPSFGLFYITGLTFSLSLSSYLTILWKGALAHLNHYHSFCPTSYVLIVHVHFGDKVCRGGGEGGRGSNKFWYRYTLVAYLSFTGPVPVSINHYGTPLYIYTYRLLCTRQNIPAYYWLTLPFSLLSAYDVDWHAK